ncbi:MAG: hypothetical protein ACD_82C00161G0001 [uncultured bacterium]|nr:MAG: hypothetical protein ACD_82C00161G0001 [uncultured bacterium]
MQANKSLVLPRLSISSSFLLIKYDVIAIVGTAIAVLVKAIKVFGLFEANSIILVVIDLLKLE